MIERLVSASAAHPRWVVLFVLCGAIGGAAAGAWLRFDALPDVTGKQVVVITRAPGLTPEEVERRVTRPIEIALGGVPGLAAQRSITRYGISSVTAVFEDDQDLLEARQLVQERMQLVAEEMPDGVGSPELGPLTGGLGEVYQLTLTSAERTPAELHELAQLRIAPLLASVPGVVEVNSWGGERRTLDVVADPARMAQRRVTLDELSDAVTATTGQVPGATLPAGERGVLLRGVAWPRDAAELGAAVVRAGEGATVRVSDVATVREGAESRIGTATAEGRGEAVYIMVQMLLDANALEVVEGVQARMDDVRGVLPDDVAVHVVYDRSELVHATLRTVFENLLEGGALVIAVLFLMLGSLRAGALVASIIPLSMLGAVTGMVLLDVPGNLMSLGALDFGLLVDGGVVMVEGIFHASALGSGAVGDRVSQSARATARPVFYSVLIILLVYVPILALEGVEGKMFRPMAITVVLALASALLLSLTYVPAAASLFLRDRDVPKRAPWLVRTASRLYAPVLDRALSHPWLVAGFAACLLGLGGALFAQAGSDFVPQLDEGDLVIQTTRAPDIRVESASRDATTMEAAILAAVPEVAHIASRTGSPAVATDLMGLEQADVFVDLRPRGEWRATMDRARIIAAIDEAIADSAPAEEVGFTQPIQMRFNELVGGSVTDIAVSFYGDDLDALNQAASEAADAFEAVAGAEDVRVMAPPEVSLQQVRPRALDAARHGMRSAEVLAHVQALENGIEVGSTYDGPLRIPVRIRLGSSVDALTLERLPIPQRDGTLVPLSRIADVVRTRGPAMIDHEMAQRRLVVGFNVRGRDLGSVVADAETALEDRVSLPEGTRVVWGGQYESLESARGRLGLLIPTILLVIFGLLMLLFRNARPALIILLNVPFAAVGGVIALTLRGLPISVSAAVGFIALSGIAVLNGVVLVNALLGEEAKGHSPVEAARMAARSRLRPVLMTALVASLGFLPMMLAEGAGAEVQRPLATVVVGGLTTSTFLTLVILPAVLPWLRSQSRAEPA